MKPIIPDAALLSALATLTAKGHIQVTATKSIPMWVLLRCWNKVQFTDSCWLFSGLQRSKYRHCCIEWAGDTFFVHRVIYAMCNGPIPEGMVVRHRCDIGNCIRPDHLVLERGRAKRPPTFYGAENHKVVQPDEKVAQLRAAYAAGGEPLRSLAAKYHVSMSTAWRWVNSKVRA